LHRLICELYQIWRRDETGDAGARKGQAPARRVKRSPDLPSFTRQPTHEASAVHYTLALSWRTRVALVM
jgi:hypothetical protein